MKFYPGKEIDYIDDMIILQERQKNQKDINIKYNKEEEKKQFKTILKKMKLLEKRKIYI